MRLPSPMTESIPPSLWILFDHQATGALVSHGICMAAVAALHTMRNPFEVNVDSHMLWRVASYKAGAIADYTAT